MTDRKRFIVLICLLLAAVTFWVYWPVTHHEFVSYDDPDYILDNPQVRAGLGWPGMVWAFTTTRSANWHPLTWISHELDGGLYGLNPAGHHLTNLLLHTANTVLLFLWLYQMTGARCRSAFVAALFGWHPLHVESVAWASERKDVLSTLFWLLTMMAYVHYAQETGKINKPGRRRTFYGTALVCFALGLMCKPMLVTLPGVLLLLDYWPLERIANDQTFRAKAAASIGLKDLFLEKVPFGILSAISCTVTYFAQQSGRAVASAEMVSFPSRIANALVSYSRYLGKIVWPGHLSIIYPYVNHWPLTLVAGSALLLLVLTGGCFALGRLNPYLVVGWLWFLGTLVPVIGLVQVGLQSMADRYTYVPAIGLFICAVWGLGDLVRFVPRKEFVLGGAGILVLVGCVAATRTQLGYWQNSETLFCHAIAVTQGNYVACDALGVALESAGRPQEAHSLFEECVRLEPGYPQGQRDLAIRLLNEGHAAEAVGHLETAIRFNPGYAPAHSLLGKTLLQQGKPSEAFDHLSTAVHLAPDDPTIRFNLGIFFLLQSKIAEAAGEFARVLSLDPGYADAHLNLGIVLMQAGRPEAGIAELGKAVQLDLKNPAAHANLGVALLKNNQPALAAEHFQAALQLDPDNSQIHCQLAGALARQRKYADAILQFRSALRLQPDFAIAMNGLAWTLATASDAGLRNGVEATQLAARACELTHDCEPAFLMTLAAANAETGRFSEALATAGHARDLAFAAGDSETADRLKEMMRIFQSGQPYHQER